MTQRRKNTNKQVPEEEIAQLTPEQLDALRRWAKYHGRTWKRSAWMSGAYGRSFQDVCGSLQQVRNQFGPSWLVKFKLP